MSIDTYIYSRQPGFLPGEQIYIYVYTFNELQTQKDSVDR